MRVTSRNGADRSVAVSDQFNQSKTYRLLDPARLCVPTSKDGEPTENPLVDLLCYAVTPARGEPKQVPVVGIVANDEFGAQRLRTAKEEEVCVPSEVR